MDGAVGELVEEGGRELKIGNWKLKIILNEVFCFRLQLQRLKAQP